MIAKKVTIDKGLLRGAQISDGWWRHFLQRHPDFHLEARIVLVMCE